MEKYDTYSLTDAKMQRIDLHKNFRSRNEVLDFSNDIFYRIMKRDLGNVEYDADAALYPGASYQEETDMFTPEIYWWTGMMNCWMMLQRMIRNC